MFNIHELKKFAYQGNNLINLNILNLFKNILHFNGKYFTLIVYKIQMLYIISYEI